ncbi:MAG: hypothetical protein HY842_14805 [Bacteroidetes bacterium]|nr:hypothetical protein [Bacteroidota bacterium]
MTAKTPFQSTCHGGLTDKMAVFTGNLKDFKIIALFQQNIQTGFSLSQITSLLKYQALLLPTSLCRYLANTNGIMNDVRQFHGLGEKETDRYIGGEIHGKNVRDLVTKFFYKDNHLCFHILLRVDGGETVFFREFTDYAEYKKAFSDLQQAKLSNIIINVPEKSLDSSVIAANVA